jgi:nucleoside-triphosphatase THEP1
MELERRTVPELVSHNSPDSLLASFLFQEELHPYLVILSGNSGAGKTSWCQRLVERAQVRGLMPAGLLSPAVFQDSEKVAIDLRDLASGQQRRLANRDLASSPGENPILASTNSHWKIDPNTVAWGNAILAGLDGPPLLVIDELGPLEFERGQGFTAGLELLDSQLHGFACVVIRPSLLAEAQKRWPWARVVHLVGLEAAL